MHQLLNWDQERRSPAFILVYDFAMVYFKISIEYTVNNQYVAVEFQKLTKQVRVKGEVARSYKMKTSSILHFGNLVRSSLTSNEKPNI